MTPLTLQVKKNNVKLNEMFCRLSKDVAVLEASVGNHNPEVFRLAQSDDVEVVMSIQSKMKGLKKICKVPHRPRHWSLRAS